MGSRAVSSFCGEKICRMLQELQAPKEYICKAIGMMLDAQSVDELQELVQDREELRVQIKNAHEILLAEKWDPEVCSVQLSHDDLFAMMIAEKRYNAETASCLVTVILDQGGEVDWCYLWSNPDRFHEEVSSAFQALMLRERRPVEEYLNPDKVKKAHKPQQLVIRSSYHKKICKFFESELRFRASAASEGWTEGLPSQGPEGSVADDDCGDIGEPPTDEGVVDEVQQERDDLEFRSKYSYGKGGSKWTPPKQICWKFHGKGCTYGENCHFSHDPDVSVEGHQEAGKKWDDASRQALRDAGLNKVCFDFHLHCYTASVGCHVTEP